MNMWRGTRRWIGLAAVSMLLLAGCSGGGSSDEAANAPVDDAETSPADDGDSSPDAEGETETVTLGVTTPQSGGGADFGVAFLNGVQAAVDDLNESGGVEAGGVTYEFEVSTCDDEFDGSAASSCAQRLKQQDDVPVLFAPGSYAIFPILGMNEQPGSEFLLLGASATPDATQQGNELYIRTWSNSARTMDGWVELLNGYSGESDVALESVAVLEVNNDYGQAWANDFEEAWNAAGGEISGRAVVDANSTDFYSTLTPLIQDDPDAIALTTVCEPSAVIIEQALELGFEGVFINGSGCDASLMLGLLDPADIEGMIFEASSWARSTPEIEEWREEYEQEFGNAAQLVSANGYASVKWYAEGIEMAETVDPHEVRQVMDNALAQLPEEDNILAWENLDEQGDINWPMHIAHVSDGSVENYPAE